MNKPSMVTMAKITAIGLVSFGIVACAVGPDYAPPAAAPAKSFTRQSMTDELSYRPISDQWWKSYESARINTLVEKALRHNPSVEAGLANLKAAQENVTAQRGLFYPTVQAGYGFARQNAGGVLASPLLSGNPLFNLHTAQLNMGYTPDLWGGNLRQVESLQALSKGQQYQYDAVRLGVIGNVVAAAIQERSLSDLISVVNDSMAVSREQLLHMRTLRTAGYSSGMDVAAQELADAQTRALLPPLQKQLELTRNLIAVLCGQTPDAQEVLSSTDIPIRQPDSIPSMLPSDLVKHRPDVQAAQEQLHAAHALIGVATSNMLPQITLTAGLSASNGTLANLLAATNQSWGLFAGIVQPIFNAGTLSARKRSAEAQTDAARAQYQSVVLQAFQNVADTLYALQEDRRAQGTAREVEAANQQLLAHLKQQLQLGYVSRLAMLNGRQALLQAKLSRLATDAAVLTDTVSMHLALGGGWSVMGTNPEIKVP